MGDGDGHVYLAVVRVCRAPSLGSATNSPRNVNRQTRLLFPIAAASEAQTNQLQPSDLRDIVLSCLIVVVRLYITSQSITKTQLMIFDSPLSTLFDANAEQRSAAVSLLLPSSLRDIFSEWEK
jgi:hypothetical protein